MRKLGWSAAALVLAAAIGAPHAAAQHHSHTGERAMKNIVAVATEAGSFQTLLTAAQAAGLAEVLQGPGPFTVFAPTDEAFAALPKGTIEALLTDKEALRAILTYHVVPGRLTAEEILRVGGSIPATVNGQSLSIRVEEGKVKVDDATVISADVMASNGIIHVIDAVVLPKQAPVAAGAAH
ncbi:fasciclin domain-containing protein [soil metagenome]